jgi:fatty-acyl-CoA synthase
MPPREETIQGVLRERLERHPDRRAVGFARLDGAIDWLTTAELHRAAAAQAAWLSGAGLRAGQPAVLVSSEPRFAATAVLGILQLGAVPLLIAPPAIQGVNSNLGEVIRHVVGLSAARLVLLPLGMERTAAALAERHPGTTPIVGEPKGEAAGEPGIEVPDPQATAMLQLTSGTTGLPRICVWRHPQVLTAVEGMTAAMRLADDDVFANWTPLYHDMGLVNNFMVCLLRGIPLVLMNPIDFIRRPALWLQVIHAAGATETWAPNFGYAIAAQRIADAELEGVRLDHVRGFWNAGEKVHIGTFEEFHRRFESRGVRWEALKANFGCAENVGGATFTDPEGALVVERVESAALYERREAVVADSSYEGETERLVSTGKGHPLLRVHVLDDEGFELPDGTVGEVALESPSRLIGFLGQPEASAQVIRGPYVITGDLGYLRGGELYWVGRSRERINLAGVKHDPSDFEAPLDEVEGLRKGCFAAFGVEDRRLGTQRLVLVCEVAENVERLLPEICDDVRRRVSVKLGVTASEVALVGKGMLTKTSSGKRRHLHFRDLYLGGGLPLLHRVGAVNPGP